MTRWSSLRKLQAPVVHVPRARSTWMRQPDATSGMTGLVGFESGYHAMAACDTSSCSEPTSPYNQFLPTKAKVIQLDIRGSQIGWRIHVDLPSSGRSPTPCRC